MPKLHSFLYVIHKATAETKAQAHLWCQKQKLLWFVIALEPYIEPGKSGFHLHLMFRCKHPRATTAITNAFCQLFGKEREDVWQERLQGRFKDQTEYVTNEYAGEHADNPKKLDPEPIIFPQDGDPDEVKPKMSVKDQVIEDLMNGATLKWVFKTYPKFWFDNEKKIRKFQEDLKKDNLIRYICAPGGGPRDRPPSPPPRVEANWETPRRTRDFLDEIFFSR